MSEHAIQNARAWAETIIEAMSAYAQLNDGETESVTFDGDTFDDVDELRERIESIPLSVQVRSGWYSPGTEATKPEEFEILLSTGGPALRMVGQLDEYGQAHGSHDLQWQDWGTPWTDYCPEGYAESKALAKALSAFAGCFYFGD